MSAVSAPRPYLFLDIDGVLNPYAAPVCPPGFTEHDLFPPDEPVRVCAGHAAWIRRLQEVFEVVWATSWNHDANDLLAPLLGIGPLPVAVMPAPPFDPAEKVGVLDRYAGSRPAAWIDDQHTPAAAAWAGARPHATLLLPADPAAGLTRALVDRALAWNETATGLH